ncbi:MAG: DNA-formamidopyrimidine glycosylase [Anaerolineales bacterium]
MPELPEVEIIVRDLRRQIVGETIDDVRVRWARSIDRPNVETFIKRLCGQRIREVRRRGKFVIVDLSQGHLLIHLRMTGQLLLCDGPRETLEEDKHVHVILLFASGRLLYFRDMRKFGRFYLVDDADEMVGDLGPEPLAKEFTPTALAKLFEGRRARVKSLLLDQHVLAGLGNIYTDESLWKAGIHPCRPVNDLNLEEMARLHGSILQVLRSALENRGTTLQSYRDPNGRRGRNQERLAIYGRAGEACPRCGQTIERDVMAGRGTYYCPECQPWDDSRT